MPNVLGQRDCLVFRPGIAELSPFGKYLSILCLFVNLVVFYLLVTKTGGTVVVITPVPVHCLPY